MPEKGGRWTFGEMLGLLGVVASLVFVGYEIRQNTVAAQSAAYQAIGVATAEMHASVARDPDLARLMTNDSTSLAEMSRLDWSRIRSQGIAWLRLAETVHLQVEGGLLREDAMSRLGYANGFAGRRNACIWPSVQNTIGTPFREYLESAIDFALYDCTDILAATK